MAYMAPMTTKNGEHFQQHKNDEMKSQTIVNYGTLVQNTYLDQEKVQAQKINYLDPRVADLIKSMSQ